MSSSSFGLQIKPILISLLVTDSSLSGQDSGKSVLPSGSIKRLSTNLSTVGTGGLPKKGQTFALIQIIKAPAIGGTYSLPLAGDYVFKGNDLHWEGDALVEDGDQIVVSATNSFASNFVIRLLGYMVRSDK